MWEKKHTTLCTSAGAISSYQLKDSKSYKNGGNVPKSEIAAIVSMHRNIVRNNNQLESIVLEIFVPKKTFAKLLQT